jgi:hypothetical protein
MDELKAGDTLLVWRLDRLGRSMPHLVTLIEELGKKTSASGHYATEQSIPRLLRVN